MSTSNKIFLIGMPGCGKSTTGQKLAEKIGYQWIDLDHEIEKKTGMRIQALINTTSEKYFREVEHSLFTELINKNKFVMSCGGGTPCYFDHISLMNQAGTTIWLSIPVNVLAERIMNEPDKRPLIATASLEKISAKLTELLEQRQKYYSKAGLKFSSALECLAYFS